MRRSKRFIAAGLLLLSMSTAAGAKNGPPPADAMDELRKGFTLAGSPVPPLVFRDLGDGNLADDRAMMVTVDAWAAIGSNQFFGDVKEHGRWRLQTTEPSGDEKSTETEKYDYLGATPDGLLVAVTVHSQSDGSFAPAMLYVLDPALRKAVDYDGKIYERVDLTIVATYPLGDGWTGKATLSGDKVTVLTEGGAHLSKRSSENTKVYEANRLN